MLRPMCSACGGASAGVRDLQAADGFEDVACLDGHCVGRACGGPPDGTRDLQADAIDTVEDVGLSISAISSHFSA